MRGRFQIVLLRSLWFSERTKDSAMRARGRGKREKCEKDSLCWE